MPFAYFHYTMYSKLASAIYNDVMSGLRGTTSNPSISLDQLEDDIIDERLAIIKEYSLKGILPKKDLLISINCILVDCKSISGCCDDTMNVNGMKHFEIPQLISDFGVDGIEYIGAIDKQLPFTWYTDINNWTTHKYRKRGKNKPVVYINTTPNNNNLYDGYITNAPFLKSITVIGMFKDPKQAFEMDCCNTEFDNPSFLNNEIKRRLTEKKLRFYRQLQHPITINDQTPK